MQATEKGKARMRAYYQRNRERLLDARKQRYEKKRAEIGKQTPKRKGRQPIDKEREKERKRAWYLANKERVAQHQAEYWAAKSATRENGKRRGRPKRQTE